MSFSRMRSKGSRFALGVWGLRVCSLDVAFTVATVRNRSQQFATVRNRPRDCYMAVPMVSSAGGVLFVGFKRLVASFRVAGVALCDIQTCFVTCWKSFCVAGAILLRRFQKMCCIFRGRRSTLDVSIVIFRGRRSTLDVSCCVFFVNRIGRAASSGDKVQIPWQAWYFVTCTENWRKPRTKHRFWGLWFSCGLAVSMGEAAKLILLSCCQLWKLEEVSYEIVFLHSRVSSRISGFLVASPCLWGKLQNVSFLKVSKQVVMSFCVAGVALCDIPTCLITCRKCQN